jgi:rubrerythrin
MKINSWMESLLLNSESSVPVVSVYLNTWWQNEHHRQIVRVFVREHIRRTLKHTPADEQGKRLAQNLQWIENYVNGLIRQRHEEWATGVALFCKDVNSEVPIISLRVPFEPMEFIIDRKPWITSLLRSCGVTPAVLLVMVNGKGGDIYESHCGILDHHDHLVRSLPNRHPQKGFNQQKQERYFEEVREKNLLGLAELTTQKLEENPDLMIVVAGQQFLIRAFEQELPNKARTSIVARLTVPSAQESGQKVVEIINKVQPQIEETLRNRFLAESQRILAAAANGGPGTAGVAASLAALSQGRVYHLLVDGSYRAWGYKCTVCGSLWEKQDEEKCPYCNGALNQVEFPEEIFRRAILDHAKIDIVPSTMTFSQNKIMAQLRYS